MIGDRIRYLRKQRGYSQQQLANKLDITQGAISQWENNQTFPGSEQLSAIANLFNITIDELMGRNEPAQPAKENDMELYATIGKQVVDMAQSYSQAPKTLEARIVSFGMDQLPQEEREKILSILQTMYNNNPAIFKKDGEDI